MQYSSQPNSIEKQMRADFSAKKCVIFPVHQPIYDIPKDQRVARAWDIPALLLNDTGTAEDTCVIIFQDNR